MRGTRVVGSFSINRTLGLGFALPYVCVRTSLGIHVILLDYRESICTLIDPLVSQSGYAASMEPQIVQ